MDIIYLLYGAAFLALGLVVLVKNNRQSNLLLARLLWLLATFGFLHGLQEWLELWQLLHGPAPAVKLGAAALLFASFLFLLEFGRRLFLAALSHQARRHRLAKLLSPWLHAPILLAILSATVLSSEPLASFVVWTRVLPGFLGACLTAAGCHLYCKHRLCNEDMVDNPPSLLNCSYSVAPTAFLAYGLLAGLVVPGAGHFPIPLATREEFLAVAHVPVELLRATCAGLIAWSMADLLDVFERESRHRLHHSLALSSCALDELRQLNHRYEAILASVSEGIVGLGRDGRVILVNGAALLSLGYRKDELMGQDFHELAHHTCKNGDPHAPGDCPVLKTLRHQSPATVTDDVFWRSNGSRCAVSYRITPLQNGEETGGVVVVFREKD